MLSSTGRDTFPLVAASCLLVLVGCGGGDPSVASEPAPDASAAPGVSVAEAPEARPGKIWAPGEGDHFWVFPESKETLGPGGEFHIYVDPETEPAAKASFARFALGAGGALPEHRHVKTEEFAYFISGEGIARLYEDGTPRDVSVGPGYVWYNPPGEWHSVANTGDEPLVMVFATVPNEKKGLLSFFRRISVKPGEEPTVLPPEEFGRIAAEHDLILKPGPVAD